MKNPDDAIPREISPNFKGNTDISQEIRLRLACSLATQLTTLQAASLAWLDLPPRLCAVVGGRARASVVPTGEGLAHFESNQFHIT